MTAWMTNYPLHLVRKIVKDLSAVESPTAEELHSLEVAQAELATRAAK